MANCKECKAMSEAVKNKMTTAQKCSVLKVLIVCLAVCLFTAILVGGILFDKHMTALEQLLNGAEMTIRTLRNC